MKGSDDVQIVLMIEYIPLCTHRIWPESELLSLRCFRAEVGKLIPVGKIPVFSRFLYSPEAKNVFFIF
jgi:hypothetical protein